MADPQDRLYQLLPPVYRERDAGQGYALRDFLRVLGREVDLLDRDIGHLYDNWFIETCDEWVVPYIADLIGFVPPSGATLGGRALTPRQQVADTIRARRRKGTLALLGSLARDTAGWPARPVEFYKLLSKTQHLKHLRIKRGLTVNLRDGDALDLLNGPFERTSHTNDVRSIASSLQQGWFNPAAVGVFAWPMGVFSVTRCKAKPLGSPDRYCYTFSYLGNNTPLYANPAPQTDIAAIADESHFPVTIRRRALDAWKDRYYGEGKSFVVYEDRPDNAVAASRIIPANLSDWERYTPEPGNLVVDPVLGRMVFAKDRSPGENVWVSYHYGFSAPMGGGEYVRPLSQPTPCKVYVVAKSGQVLTSIHDAVHQWHDDLKADEHAAAKDPALQHAVIEVADSEVYEERVSAALGENQTLQIRAAVGARPVLVRTSDIAAIQLQGSAGSRFTLDGLLVVGRPVSLDGLFAAVTIRHSTLLPGWELQQDPRDAYGAARPVRGEKPSLALYNTLAVVRIENSIVGSIEVQQDEVSTDPLTLIIEDSIVDATSVGIPAISGVRLPKAHAVLTVRRSTIIGKVEVHAIQRAEDCIFEGQILVARRNRGCMRFCYVWLESRTPRRYHCQPDLARAEFETGETLFVEGEPALPQELANAARESVKPAFSSLSYGTPGYCRLRANCPDAIRTGASDQGEMGVFHNLYEPQRAAMLRALLAEHTPAKMDAGLILIESGAPRS